MEQRINAYEKAPGAPFCSDRERMALAWAEAVTHTTEGHVPDDVFSYFSTFKKRIQ